MEVRIMCYHYDYYHQHHTFYYYHLTLSGLSKFEKTRPFSVENSNNPMRWRKK